MTVTREHMAGLELAYELSQMNSFPVSFERSLEQLIEQAQSAEPVQGEAVEVVGVRISTDGFGSYIADSAMGIGAAQPGEVREPLMTVAQHQKIMAAFSPSSKPVAWINSYTLAESATKKFGSYYLSPTRSDEDDTPLYTSPAKPDAELVELLRELSNQPFLGAKYRKRIDAKLAEANKP
jgi:hypothetical protein